MLFVPQQKTKLDIQFGVRALGMQEEALNIFKQEKWHHQKEVGEEGDWESLKSCLETLGLTGTYETS